MKPAHVSQQVQGVTEVTEFTNRSLGKSPQSFVPADGSEEEEATGALIRHGEAISTKSFGGRGGRGRECDEMINPHFKPALLLLPNKEPHFIIWPNGGTLRDVTSSAVGFSVDSRVSMPVQCASFFQV